MSGKKKKILIAEDETHLRNLYSELLESEGFFVDAVTNGKEAIEKMKKYDYQLVMLDIRMPEMDGLAVSKQVALHFAKYHSPKIVFLTNLSQNEVISDALHAKIAGYLIKGKLTPNELIEEVQRYTA